MKYLALLAVLFLSSCGFNEPRFKMNQKVKVVSGFYKGQVGYIRGKEFGITGSSYEVLVLDPFDKYTIKASELSAIEGEE